jgi:hypothetical protein
MQKTHRVLATTIEIVGVDLMASYSFPGTRLIPILFLAESTLFSSALGICLQNLFVNFAAQVHIQRGGYRG